MPVVFIVLGLVLGLVHTVPVISSADPERSLTLSNTAINEDDIRTFYAEFGNRDSIFEVRQR